MLIFTSCYVVYSYITTKHKFRNFKSWVIHVPETSETVKILRWERLLVITCKNIYIYVLMQRGFYFSNYMNTNQSFTADKKESNNRVAFSNFDENTTLLPLVWVQWRAIIPLRTLRLFSEISQGRRLDYHYCFLLVCDVMDEFVGETIAVVLNLIL